MMIHYRYLYHKFVWECFKILIVHGEQFNIFIKDPLPM